MPNKTTNYQLNQWNPEDDFLRTDFNEDNTNLESALTSLQSSITSLQNSLSAAESSLSTAISNAKPVFGSYTGAYKTSVSTTTAINLGFQPSLVMVMEASGRVTDSGGNYCGMAFPGSSGNSITITSTGFTVANKNFSYLNYQDWVFHYIALR